MAMDKKSSRTIGFVLFLVGTLLLIYIGVLSTWGEVEATFFNSALRSDEPLDTLSCPAVITPNETSYVSASFFNPADKPIELEIRTYVTEGFVTLMTEYITEVPLEPQETKFIQIPIFPENAAYNRFVMVRMHQMKQVPLPYMNASCGVVLVNVPLLTGTQFIIFIISFGLILSTLGITLWGRNSRPLIWLRLRKFQAMIIFTVAALVFAIIALLNYWFFAIILLIVWILMGIGMVFHFSTISKGEVDVYRTPIDE